MTPAGKVSHSLLFNDSRSSSRGKSIIIISRPNINKTENILSVFCSAKEKEHNQIINSSESFNFNDPLGALAKALPQICS
jgi:hypothetical protein